MPGTCRIAKFLALARVTTGHDIISVTALTQPFQTDIRFPTIPGSPLDFLDNPISGKY